MDAFAVRGSVDVELRAQRRKDARRQQSSPPRQELCRFSRYPRRRDRVASVAAQVCHKQLISRTLPPTILIED